MADRGVAFTSGGGCAQVRRFPARSGARGLSLNTLRIMELLADDTFPVLVKEISETLGISHQSVGERLAWLMAQGLVDDVHSLTDKGRFLLASDRANFREAAADEAAAEPSA